MKLLLLVTVTGALWAQEKAPVEIVTDADGRVIDVRGKLPEPTPPPKLPTPQQQIPPETAESVKEGVTTVSTTIHPSGVSDLDKTKQVAFEHHEKLPNFICERHTLRYEGEGRNPKWKLQDRLTADVVSVDGGESLLNVRRNGKLLKGKLPEESGAWSTGEFASVYVDVLQDSTAARFRAPEASEVRGRPAKKFTYTVEKPNSHWKVHYGGAPLFPAYKGALWVDNATHQVVRVEMSARQIPKDYPLDAVEMTVEYGQVKIAGELYLMPVLAENLACYRDTATCTRNENQYLNYKKFSAQSTIMATDSSVTFDGEKKEEKPDFTPPSIDAEENPKKKRKK